VRPLGVVNSLLGFFAQRDDGEYYRTHGVELAGENANAGWWSARVYAQRERAAAVETDLSLATLFGGSGAFRPNITADEATQFGAALTLRGRNAWSRTLSFGAETTLDGATGDYDFGRAAATVRRIVTPPGPVAGALSLSAGSSAGEVPVQSRFYLGGSGSLRGFAGGAQAGSAFWVGRLEVGNAFPAARLTAFTDVGWAGDRGSFGSGRPLIGAGIGASFFDGLVRVDLARALRAPTGTRLEIYFDGVI
jgi:hemolysin activation/secretion protein